MPPRAFLRCATSAFASSAGPASNHVGETADGPDLPESPGPRLAGNALVVPMQQLGTVAMAKLDRCFPRVAEGQQAERGEAMERRVGWPQPHEAPRWTKALADATGGQVQLPRIRCGFPLRDSRPPAQVSG